MQVSSISEREVAQFKSKIDLGLYAELDPKEPLYITVQDGNRFKLPCQMYLFGIIDIINEDKLEECMLVLAAEVKNKYTGIVTPIELTVFLDEAKSLTFIH